MLGAVLTLYLPLLPFFLMAVEVVKRLNEAFNPFVATDWKFEGPGRVFFVRPDSLVASLTWDFYMAVSVLCGR